MLKIRFSHISIAIVMAMVVSCSRNGDNSGIETVELQDLVPKDVNISSFTTGVETVGLESREDCLVGMIRDLEIGDTRRKEKIFLSPTASAAVSAGRSRTASPLRERSWINPLSAATNLRVR